MKTKATVSLLVIWTSIAFLAGIWYNRHNSRIPTGPQARRILYYHDPMHPSYRSDKPGIAPDCGMQLEPVYADGGAAGAGTATSSDSTPPGAIQISREKQQIAGVRVAQVEKSAGHETVRLLGRVAVDEDRIFRIVTALDGWIRDTYPNSAGSMVKKDELLVTLYARDFFSSQTAYFFALDTVERFQRNGQDTPAQMTSLNSQLHAAEENLQILGMSDAQIKKVAKSRQASRNIEILSPADGLVLARNVYKGQRFDRNTELYRIAELDHVWIQADVFERERQYIRPRAAARIRYQGRLLPARVSGVPPQFDAATRTLKLRLEAENPGQVLRPDMFVDVEFPVDLPAAVAIPADAVLDSGLKKTVFVDCGNGVYEPRAVETGWRFGDRVEIVRGLDPGERIVVSGNFLIDSESRLKAGAQAAMDADVKDPVCGMDVDPAKASGKSENKGKTYYFCSKSCKEKFDKNPESYLGKQTLAHRTPGH